jgi:hypothetical protein
MYLFSSSQHSVCLSLRMQQFGNFWADILEFYCCMKFEALTTMKMEMLPSRLSNRMD